MRPELLRAFEIGARLGERSLELADLASCLLDRGLGALDRRVVPGEQGVELAAVEAGENLSLRHPVAVVDENLGQAKAVERRADHRFLARNQRPRDEQAFDEFAPFSGLDADGRRRRRGRRLGGGGPCGAVRGADRQAEAARGLDGGGARLKPGEAPAARDHRGDDGDNAKNAAHRNDSVPTGASLPSHSALNSPNARSPSASASKSGSQATRCRRPLT